MNREEISLCITILFFSYCLIAIVYFGSLFQNYFLIPTVLFSLVYSFLIVLDKKKIDDILDISFKLSSSVIAIVLLLLTFVLTTGKNIILDSLMDNALYAVGWLILFLFGSIIFAITGKGLNGKNSETSLRLSIFMFILGLLILTSLISGITLSQ